MIRDVRIVSYDCIFVGEGRVCAFRRLYSIEVFDAIWVSFCIVPQYTVAFRNEGCACQLAIVNDPVFCAGIDAQIFSGVDWPGGRGKVSESWLGIAHRL